MRYLITLLTLVFITFACKKKDAPEFDRKAMLSDMQAKVISPAYINLSSKMGSFNSTLSTFLASPSLDNLTNARTAFLTTYLAYQHVSCFDFGPALDYGLNASLNTYPTDTVKIKANISSGTYTLGAAENIAAIGLPALDYLLFSGSDLAVINRFTTDENAAATQIYCTAIIEKMKSETEAVVNSWETGYAATFKAADGTDVGSSLSLLYNGFVKDLELLKNAKIGIPSGQFSGGEPLPAYVEAYYSGKSQLLALENTSALKTVFKGADGIGFDDYLNFIEQENSLPVNAITIENQFDLCYAKITALGDPFSADIPVNFSGFSTTFQELKKLVAYAKTDLSSALGILITFSDTDGD